MLELFKSLLGIRQIGPLALNNRVRVPVVVVQGVTCDDQQCVTCDQSHVIRFLIPPPLLLSLSLSLSSSCFVTCDLCIMK